MGALQSNGAGEAGANVVSASQSIADAEAATRKARPLSTAWEIGQREAGQVEACFRAAGSVSCAVRTTPARAGPGRARGERARAFAGPQAAYGRSWKLRPPAYQEAYRPRYLRISGVPARRRPLRSDVSLPDRAALPDDAPPPKASHPALASGRDAVPDTAS